MPTIKDYYKMLEVSKNASPVEIKKSFKRLAKLYHPDSNPDDKTLDAKFKEVNEANAVLSDPQKRKEYDYSLANSGKPHFQRSTSSDAGVNDILNKFDDFKF